MMSSGRSALPNYKNVPSRDAAIVSEKDLEFLPVLHELLGALNDVAAGATVIARHVERLPALRARIALAFARSHASPTLPSVAAQLTYLGNGEIEAILLQFLEDLTILRAELSEDGR